MTKQQGFKRRVRGRMAKTGESYSSARRQLLAKQGTVGPDAEVDKPAVEQVAPAVDDRAAAARLRLQKVREDRIERATGRPAAEWFRILAEAGASGMDHRAIWRWLAESAGVDAGMAREEITIAFEQHIGRRQVGQSCEGDFRASVSKALPGTLDEVFDRWLALVADHVDFDGVALAAEPSVSGSELYRYWRARLADGGRLQVTVYLRPDGRISFGIDHRPHPDRESADRWKQFWRDLIAPLSVREAV